LLAVILGFVGMLLLQTKLCISPGIIMAAGLLSGITSAIAYITLEGWLYIIIQELLFYHLFLPRAGPSIFMLIKYFAGFSPDNVFFIAWQWPKGIQWLSLLSLGLAALFGQYFVTKLTVRIRPALFPLLAMQILSSLFLSV